jgi:hypothetical protein
LSDPAYAAQTPGLADIIGEAMHFFSRHDMFPVGRYARWEYSSMSQVLHDGFAIGERFAARAPAAR